MKLIKQNVEKNVINIGIKMKKLFLPILIFGNLCLNACENHFDLKEYINMRIDEIYQRNLEDFRKNPNAKLSAETYYRLGMIDAFEEILHLD